MSGMQTIEKLFASDITRRIEEVIKVDQTDEDLLREEIGEYVTTDAIGSHYVSVLEAYADTPNKPHEGVGVWVSGFFGSGKSSFAKMLGLAIQNRVLAGIPASKRFAERAGDNKLTVLLTGISEKIPTHAVIFDVSTDRGIRSGNQTLTEIMYGLFLQSLGYAKDLDLSELEIALEKEGRLAAFEQLYNEQFGKEWSADKGLLAFSMGRASQVMHLMEPATYPAADSWIKGVKDRSDISPNKLAERASELMERRRPGQSLLFVVDEVGQFVARDVQKMLDLQAVVQSLGRLGRGKHWLVVTSQEKLGELVSGLDDKQIELARLMDRFPQQVHLEPSDISEVTSRRVLSKNADAEATLGALFDQHRARLTESTRIRADIQLPELSRQGFIDLYPLLPVPDRPDHPGGLRACGRRAEPASTSAAPTGPSSSSLSRSSSTPPSTSPAPRLAHWPGWTTSTTSSRATLAPRSGRRSRPFRRVSRTPTRWPSQWRRSSACCSS